MYRIKVLSNGKRHNVEMGNHYYLFRKSAVCSANSFGKSGCDLVIEKFIHVGDDFFWSNALEETKICKDDTDIISYHSLTRKEYKELF